MISKSRRETARADAMRRSVNHQATTEKIVPVKQRSTPTSFRLPADLIAELEAFTYSARNTRHLNRTQIVTEAIREYIRK